MKIKSATISKFRGFQNEQLEAGTHLTAIAGQNGTQKSTLLGMLCQPFTFQVDPSIDLEGTIGSPLCGGSWKSNFSEMFRLSEAFDIPKSHEWTMHYSDGEDFTIESMPRNKANGTIRFWKKGSRERGDGYNSLPVIYLSLRRLFPLGEDSTATDSTKVTLTESESNFYQKWHNHILLLHETLKRTQYVTGSNKHTIGVDTDFYDWNSNSAGQDNIGKILLAVISFQRLKSLMKNNYPGGILAIDEIDASLYPASQTELIKALLRFCSDLSLQVFFTTHSLESLQFLCEIQNRPHQNGQVKVALLRSKDRMVSISNSVDFMTIVHNLNVSMPTKEEIKIRVFTEDSEAIDISKALLKSKAKHLDFVKCTFSSGNLLELCHQKVPGFLFPESLIVLDGDVVKNASMYKRARGLQNVLLLPGGVSPESLLASYLIELPESHSTWKSIGSSYTKQFCFRDYKPAEIHACRDNAKAWYKSQQVFWGRNSARVINSWIKDNQQTYQDFIDNFAAIHNKLALRRGIDAI